LAQKIKFTSPFGTANYPHISKPDTVGKYADNKFKTKLVISGSNPAAKAFADKIDEAAKAIHGPKGAKMYVPYVYDEDSNEYTFTFKTSYAPAVFDGRNTQLPAKLDKSGERIGCKIAIGGGSELRVMGQFVEFEKGISAQFNQVQVKSLNGSSSGFDAVDDGYAYDGGSIEADDSDDDDTMDDAGDDSSDALDI